MGYEARAMTTFRATNHGDIDSMVLLLERSPYAIEILRFIDAELLVQWVTPNDKVLLDEISIVKGAVRGTVESSTKLIMDQQSRVREVVTAISKD